jgi:tRNA(fMet)-specific endonuclease VapC
VRGYLLDTNVLSEVLKRRPSDRMLAKLRAAPATALATSSVCVMELRFGAARSPGGSALWSRISRDVLALVRIFPVGADEAIRAGEVLAALEARGESIGVEDVLIAATAQVNDLVVVTRNEPHFARVRGLTVENGGTGDRRDLAALSAGRSLVVE